MFYVVCPFCHIGIEIPATATGPDCAEANNIGHCPGCDESFFFDAGEVVCDSTGAAGDAPNEMLQESSDLPIGQESFFVFSNQGKNDLYVGFETSLFNEENDTMRFSYPAGRPLTAEFEEQMCTLVREYTGDGEFLAVHHPADADAHDDATDATDATAMALMPGAGGPVRDILFL